MYICVFAIGLPIVAVAAGNSTSPDVATTVASVGP
jgi:hypothetical protein